jgi:hypothetical protein
MSSQIPFTSSISPRTFVRRLADMSPTSYQLLHPAIWGTKIDHYELKNKCPSVYPSDFEKRLF